MIEALHLRIAGRVQGVWFRASAQEQARALGLAGWVRNLPVGEVELLAEGPRPALDALLAWAHRGPPAAQVAEVRVQRPAAAGHAGFEIRRP